MKSYNQFTLEERKDLYVMKMAGTEEKEIAIKLKKSVSTIKRELTRNTNDQTLGYLPDTAHNLAQQRKAKHGSKLNRYPELKTKVINKLKIGWSPEAVAGRMRLDSPSLFVCSETIYQFVYDNEGSSVGLFKYLLRGRPKRGQMHGRKPRGNKIPERVSIDERSVQINERKEFGHFEGDLTFTIGSQSINISTIVERKSRLTLFVKNESKQMVEVMRNLFNKLALLPEEARKSITFDNGSEYTGHILLKYGMGMKTYFCDPHSPWQKGQVEKTNAMLHRYIPKNRPLADVSREELALIEKKFNDVPRKILGFRTPAEVFAENIRICCTSN